MSSLKTLGGEMPAFNDHGLLQNNNTILFNTILLRHLDTVIFFFFFLICYNFLFICVTVFCVTIYS